MVHDGGVTYMEACVGREGGGDDRKRKRRLWDSRLLRVCVQFVCVFMYVKWGGCKGVCRGAFFIGKIYGSDVVATKEWNFAAVGVVGGGECL